MGMDTGPKLGDLIAIYLRIQNAPPETTGPTYTDAEIAILKKYYPEHGAPECARLLPGHTLHSIHHVASKLGLKNRPQWQPEETRHLMTAINSCTAIRVIVAELQAQGFKRSYGGTKLKVRELKQRYITAAA
jgi:hypothetical protein